MKSILTELIIKSLNELSIEGLAKADNSLNKLSIDLGDDILNAIEMRLEASGFEVPEGFGMEGKMLLVGHPETGYPIQNILINLGVAELQS